MISCVTTHQPAVNVVTSYEALRDQYLGRRTPLAVDHGLCVLIRFGMYAWMHAQWSKINESHFTHNRQAAESLPPAARNDFVDILVSMVNRISSRLTTGATHT